MGFAGALAVFGFVALQNPGVAGAAGTDVGLPTLAVRSVDATGPTVAIDLVNTGDASPKSLSLTIDGKKANPTVQTLPQAGRNSDVVVVLDNASSTTNGPVQVAKEQLSQFRPSSSGISRLGVVTIGGGARLTVPLTTSMDSVNERMATVVPTGAPALWDGVARAAEELSQTDATTHEIVVLSAAADVGSQTRFALAQQAVAQAHASVHVVTLAGGSADTADLTDLVAAAGGSYQSGNSESLAGLFGNIATQITHQYRLTVAVPPASSGTVHSVDLSWADNDTTFGFEAGKLSVGSAALAPVAGTSLVDKILASTITKWLIILLGTLSAGMAAYSIAMLVTRQKDGLDFALRHYENYVEEDPAGFIDDGFAPISKNEIIKRAVAVTGDLAQRQGALTKVEDLLERADIPLRPAEALFFYLAAVVISAILSLLYFGSLLDVAIVVLLALVLPNFIVSFRAKRRSKKFVRQLPDMLVLLAGTLRAGYSIAQGLEAVAGEIHDPMGKELGRAMAEARLGRPLEEALDAVADRTKSEDFGWAVMAIRIQREVGGNLAELLMTVAETMTQRERLRRDVAALTAEGRMSAIILGCLPPGLGLVMYVMNPLYIGRLLTDPTGNIMLAVATVAMLAGFAWMKKLIEIEI